MIKSRIVVLLLLLLSQQALAQFPFPPPFGAEVRIPPAPVPAMGKFLLIYEMQFSNLAPMALRVSRIEVFTDDQQQPILNQSGEDLHAMLLGPATAAGGEPGVLAPGGTDVAYLWLKLDRGAVPEVLRHVIHLETTGDQVMSDSIEVTIDVASEGTILPLGPPVKGGTFVAAFGPDNYNGHRRIFLPQHGRLNIPQRYAIDYYGVGPDSLRFSGDEDDVNSYHGYGREVLAVADGVIAVAYDGVPDNVPHPSERAIPITLETVAGNHVLLDLGNGLYGFYAHFKPGSLRVKAGDRVSKGQVIAQLGNSGNTPSPHLHFTVADHTGILANEGLPYTFDTFDVVGSCIGPKETWGWFESCEFTDADTRNNEIPASWKLIRFPE
jgi:hypothetical protein